LHLAVFRRVGWRTLEALYGAVIAGVALFLWTHRGSSALRIPYWILVATVGVLLFLAAREFLRHRHAARRRVGGGQPRDEKVEHASSLETLAAAWRSLRELELTSLEPLRAAGLDEEVRRVLIHGYDSFQWLQARQTFVSWSSALELRMQQDDDEWVYVLSRRDEDPGFRNQPSWGDYLRWLNNRVRPLEKPSIAPIRDCQGLVVTEGRERGIRQVRVIIEDDEKAACDAAAEIRALHRSGTLFFFPRRGLARYEHLRDLRYGGLISETHGYAMISIPPPKDPLTLGGTELNDFLSRDYDVAEGDMRAVVTANPQKVDALVRDFRAMVASPDSVCLASGPRWSATSSGASG
jgi:hypothetical protein